MARRNKQVGSGGMNSNQRWIGANAPKRRRGLPRHLRHRKQLGPKSSHRRPTAGMMGGGPAELVAAEAARNLAASKAGSAKALAQFRRARARHHGAGAIRV